MLLNFRGSWEKGVGVGSSWNDWEERVGLWKDQEEGVGVGSSGGDWESDRRQKFGGGWGKVEL